MSASTKIKQKPKITKKSPAKARSIGGGAKSVQHVHGLARQQAKSADKSGGHGTVQLPKGVDVREYKGEGKGKGFGPGVKVVGSRG